MNFQVLTLQPDFFQAYLADGVVGQAFKKQKLQMQLIQLRDFTDDIHKSVDDRPFGGGDGMVMRPEVLQKALLSRKNQSDRVILMSAQGKKLDEKKVVELASLDSLTLICGRYAGVDQRFINQYVDEEISIGDFVLSGGELAALTVIDSVARKIPGVLGHAQSASTDSFAGNMGLEGPLFTRPQEFLGQSVPAVLTSGHHGQILIWKKRISELVTYFKRPDLAQNFNKKELQAFFEKMSNEEKAACGLEGEKFD